MGMCTLPRTGILQQLLERTKEKKRLYSPYEVIRNEILEFFHSLTKTFLVNPTKLTFHEVKFFTQSSQILRHLMPFPRGVIKTALEDPVMYLEDENLITESGSDIMSTFPGVSIAYKLHSEMGSLINLYDWLQVWHLHAVFENCGNLNFPI